MLLLSARIRHPEQIFGALRGTHDVNDKAAAIVINVMCSQTANLFVLDNERKQKKKQILTSLRSSDDGLTAFCYKQERARF
jgi:hypothetical protein